MFIMEHPIETDDLGLPPLMETSTCLGILWGFVGTPCSFTLLTGETNPGHALVALATRDSGVTSEFHQLKCLICIKHYFIVF